MATEERQREWEARLTTALESGNPDELRQVLEDMHAADLAEVFADLEQTQQQAIFDAMSDEQAATLLDEFSVDEQAHALDLLSVERASDILDEMPSDEAADLLAELPAEEANELLNRMEPEYADDVADLMRYADDTAGGLMAKEFVQLEADQTVEEVLTLLRGHHDDAEMIYDNYVLDEEGRLLGVVSLRALIATEPDTTMARIMQREFISVPVEMPQEEVAELVRRHDLLAVPVLDGAGRMQGIVTVDDVGDVVQEEAAEDLLEIGGSEQSESAQGTPPLTFGWRSGLLALLGGIIEAGLIWRFSITHADWTIVAILLPLLLVLGITAASLSLLAIDHAYENSVERHHLGTIFVREIFTGAVLATIGSVLAWLLVFFALHQHDAAMAALPLGLGLWVASIIGAAGAIVVRRTGDHLVPTQHTFIVVLALLCATGVYLLASR